MRPLGSGSTDSHPSSEALHLGKARVAVVDEVCVRVSGSQAWAWLALEPRSRRLLAVRLSWTRNDLVAHAFLKHLKEHYGIRVVVADGAPWYRWACMELGLRLHVKRGGDRSLLERLNKEAKRRLRDFDIDFPGKSLGTAKTWLRAWRALLQLGEASHDA